MAENKKIHSLTAVLKFQWVLKVGLCLGMSRVYTAWKSYYFNKVNEKILILVMIVVGY